jgi:hypothetical protein
MADGGFVRLPDGSVVVALGLPRPGAPGRVRVLVRAPNRARALTRLRNLGLRSVYLRGNAAPPDPDEITAVLHHPEGVVWRSTPECAIEPWHPMTALFRPHRWAAAAAPTTAPLPAVSTMSGGAGGTGGAGVAGRPPRHRPAPSWPAPAAHPPGGTLA